MGQISCSNGRIIVDKGLITKIEETWYGDQFFIDEKLSFIGEDGRETPLKFEGERIEPKIKTIQFHWPEDDRIGLREGYKYDKSLRAHVSKKKMVDYAKFDYSSMDNIVVKREMDAFFLKKSKFSTFGVNMLVSIEGDGRGQKGVLRWHLNPHTTSSFMKKGLKYMIPPKEIEGKVLGKDTIWFGATHYNLSNVGQLLAATTYQNNRTKIIEICIPEEDNTPENLKILFQQFYDESRWQPRKEIYPILEFKVDLSPGQKTTFKIELRFIFIPERKMNSICYIVPDSKEFWPSALASAVTIGEKREHFSALAPHNMSLNVLNPIMWYREGEKLDVSIYRYLLSLREIDKICLFGVPSIEDIQQLIIMLFDRGSELSELSFYIFTKPGQLKELYKRKEEIAESVLKTRENVDLGIIDVIKNMIKIYPIPDLMNAPLEFRKVYYQQEILSKYDKPVSEYLLVIPNDPCIASITIPLARYLQAPVLIYSGQNQLSETLVERLTNFKGKTPLAITICSKSNNTITDQLKKIGYMNYLVLFKDEYDLSTKIAQIFETLKIFNWGFDLCIQQKLKGTASDTTTASTDSEENFLHVLKQIDSDIAHNYETFLEKELDGTPVKHIEYLQTVLKCAEKHFNELISAYYANWAHLEEVVFNSAILCETITETNEDRRRCNLLMAGNYAFYRNAPLFPTRPLSEETEVNCRSFYETIDNLIGSGGNPAKAISEFGNELFRQTIPPSINEFLRIIIPNNVPYFTIWNVPLELVYDGDRAWSLNYSLGRMSGLDQYSTALLVNLAVSLAPVPKEKLKILLIANPTLDLPDASKELINLKQRLTEFEIETIEGWDARENNVIMSINRGPNIIHYSGHGYLDPILPLRSGLILTDSRLTAFEISHLKLWTNPLVFTNACLSAALGTSFLHGGACFFVSPLWSVTDFGALEYAYTFYSAITMGWSLGDAQKIAKVGVSNLLSLSTDYAHDFTWLAYSCIGDPSYSLIYTKPWEKHAFGELVYATDFVQPKNLQCARNKIFKSIFKKILNQIKLLEKKTGDPAFKPLLEPFEAIVKSISEATMDTWQNTGQNVVDQLEHLDKLAMAIENLDIQDRVRQLIRMIDKAFSYIFS
ncbi:MAG: CHAT domain-containing protein [Candidatus Helarchaeota archaeon]